MFGVFALAMKFDCLFLGIFQSFLLICDYNFFKNIHPSECMFQKTF